VLTAGEALFSKTIANNIGPIPMLLPYFEQNAAYHLFDFNVDANLHPNNMAARQQELKVLLCPSDPMGSTKMVVPGTQCPEGCGASNYQPSVGNNANYNPEAAGIYKGPMGRRYGARFRDFTDGTSNTAVFGEIKIGPSLAVGNVYPSATDPMFYTSARQLPYQTWDTESVGQSLYPGTLAGDMIPHEDCEIIGMGDYGQRGRQYYRGVPFPSFYSHTMTPNARRRDCLRAIGTDRIHAAVRSYHTGGGHVVLGDGSVRFASDNVDEMIWRAVGSIGQSDPLGEW